MAVAPRPWQTPQFPAKSKGHQRQIQPTRKVVPAIPKQTLVRKSIASSPRPAVTVKVFSMGQRFTQFLAIASVSAAVGLYATSVQYQKVWSKEYSQLIQLQDDENRIVATDESIKEQFIEQTRQPELGLVPPSPKQNIYVSAPKPVKLHPKLAPSLKPLENHAPIGY